MVVEIVYEKKDGLFPLQIAEGVNNRFKSAITTRDVEQVVKKNPKLFVEENGKIKCPPTF